MPWHKPMSCHSLPPLPFSTTPFLPPHTQTYYKFLSISSHYNTQLGLLAALGVDKVVDSPFVWLHKIPSPAAILVFELHRTENAEYWVRAVAQDGPDQEYQVVPLPCSKEGEPMATMMISGACLMDEFVGMALPRALTSTEDWCDACENTEMMACQIHQMKKKEATVGKGGGKKGNNNKSSEGDNIHERKRRLREMMDR